MKTSEKLRTVVAVCALLAGLTASTPARIIYVDGDAAGTNDGSSWADAFRCLQDALTVAHEGDQIQVAQGIYQPDQGVGIQPGDRQRSFRLVEGMTLRGGYAGAGAADPNTRNIERYQTVLSGDLRGDDPNVEAAVMPASPPSRDDNSFHVVLIEKIDSCALEGFVIRGGYAADGGGGLQIRASKPTLRNCTFTQNWAPKGGAVFVPRAYGGILSDVKIHNCRFVRNSSAQEGGALRAEEGFLYLDDHEENSHLLLADCEFVANTSVDGGAVSANLVHVSLSGCTFRANRADNGGGLHHVYGRLEITGCTFVENSAWSSQPAGSLHGRGGAVCVDLWGEQQVGMSDSLFRNNRALWGGALQSRQFTAIELRRSRFTGNVAYEHGGAVDCSGTFTGENCLFEGNQSLGSIGMADCRDAHFMNCTFVDNRSADGNIFRSLVGHGTVWSNTFTNCIVWGTRHGLDPNVFWLTQTSVTYSDVQGGYPGVGNIDLDPCWAASGCWDPNGTLDDPRDDFWVEGDYHLKSQQGRWEPQAGTWVQDEATSPCIDVGDPTNSSVEEPQPNGGRINLGAYGGTPEASKSSPGTGQVGE